MRIIEEEVPASLSGQRIDRVVSMITGSSRREAVSAIGADRVTVDGRTVNRPAVRLDAGQILRIELEHRAEPTVPAPDPSVALGIVHEDEHLVVIDKPAGLVVHPGPGHTGETLVNGLLARYPEMRNVGDPERPGIVHRLDRGTSGLLIAARTEEARTVLAAQLADRTMLRRYTTLVWNHPETPRGEIDAPIGRSPRRPTKMAVVAGGREARTTYEVIDRFTDPVEVALLDCRLETGRTHQIRVHLSAIGHAVVGDDRYGGVRESLVCPRPFLHAAEIGFVHPDGDRRRFESPLPADLTSVLGRLGHR